MSNGILSRFGIGKKMDYMMLIQSILVLIATIFTLYTLIDSLILNNFVSDPAVQIIYFVMALMLLFYSFNLSYKGKDDYFVVIMAVYAVCIFLFALLQPVPLNYLRIMELLCVIVFIYLLIDREDYKIAKKVMLIILILVIISNLYTSLIGGSATLTFKVFIVQISVAFTFFIRYLRNKCPEISM